MNELVLVLEGMLGEVVAELTHLVSENEALSQQCIALLELLQHFEFRAPSRAVVYGHLETALAYLVNADMLYEARGLVLPQHLLKQKAIVAFLKLVATGREGKWD
jgi:hypothetical protein